jgi:hypothetical protein
VSLRVQLLPLLNGEDDQGALVFQDQLLVAVMSRLSEQHGRTEGFWYVECGFGPVAKVCDQEFPDMDAALIALKAHVPE